MFLCALERWCHVECSIHVLKDDRRSSLKAGATWRISIHR